MNQPTTHPKRQAIAADLRQAQQNGELEVYYQPQVDLGTGLLIGAEALLRWNHPEKGQLTPDQFLSIAEESGLIVDIGEWVLHNACRTAVDWNQDRRRVLTIAVNLSPHQFAPNDLLASVCRTLQITGCEAEWLTLEVTETLLQHDNGAACETLEQLRDLGI
ncbi:EAL domain-containing protein, partial [Pseudomonas indica]|uniref:EAL domain-containing protein n=2 Tax=Pseudomonas indica TaxID=137658 RepID=UPI003FCFA169